MLKKIVIKIRKYIKDSITLDKNILLFAICYSVAFIIVFNLVGTAKVFRRGEEDIALVHTLFYYVLGISLSFLLEGIFFNARTKLIRNKILLRYLDFSFIISVSWIFFIIVFDNIKLHEVGLVLFIFLVVWTSYLILIKTIYIKRIGHKIRVLRFIRKSVILLNFAFICINIIYITINFTRDFDRKLFSNEELYIPLTKIGLKNIKDSNGSTLLHWAVSKGDINNIKYLIEAGIDINSQNDYGSTPMMWLLSGFDNSNKSKVDSRKIFEMLLENGADTSITNNDNQSVLVLSLTYSNWQFVKEYFNFFEPIPSQDDIKVIKNLTFKPVDFEALFEWALKNDAPKIINFIQNLGFDINDFQHSGYYSILDIFIEKGYVRRTRVLLEAGLSLEDTFNSDHLLIATRLKNIALFELLLDHGADVNYISYSYIPLWEYIETFDDNKKNNQNILIKTLSKKPKLDLIRYGENILTFTARNNKFEFFKIVNRYITDLDTKKKTLLWLVNHKKEKYIEEVINEANEVQGKILQLYLVMEE